jgi:glycogen debranching enzyme
LDAACYERISLKNYDSARRRFSLDIIFDADFHDLFEVRGTVRDNRGRRTTKVEAADQVEFEYVGLDRVTRRTVLRFDPAPRTSMSGGRRSRLNSSPASVRRSS